MELPSSTYDVPDGVVDDVEGVDELDEPEPIFAFVSTNCFELFELEAEPPLAPSSRQPVTVTMSLSECCELVALVVGC